MRDWEWFGLSIAVFDSHQRVEMSSKITIQRWKYPNLVPAVRPWLTHNAIWGKMGKIQRRVWYAGNHIPHIHYLIMWIPENRMVCDGTLKSAAPDPPPMQAATRHDRSQISRIFWDAIFVFRHLFVCLKIGYVYIHWLKKCYSVMFHHSSNLNCDLWVSPFYPFSGTPKNIESMYPTVSPIDIH